MKFWKFQAADLSTVLIDGKPQAQSGARILSPRQGIAGDQLAGIHEGEGVFEYPMDAEGNDGPSLLAAVLAQVAWQKRTYAETRGTIRIQDRPVPAPAAGCL